MMTCADIAKRCGVAVSTVYTWRKRGKLPPPDINDGYSPLWEDKTIEQWLRRKGSK